MLNALRNAMRKEGLDMFLIPTADPHGSEYPPEHFKTRRFFSGFSGSAGTLLVSHSAAGLWTDGRYFLQAARQLEGSGIELFKTGEPGVPSLEEYIASNLHGALGADLRTLSAAEGLALERRGIELFDCPHIIDELWQGRPPMPESPARSLPVELAGASTEEKLAAVRAEMKASNAAALVLTALEDCNWLFNIRGRDVKYLPVTLCYAVIEPEAAYLFIDPEKAADINDEMRVAGVTLLPYEGIYGFLARYAGGRVMASKEKLNYSLYRQLRSAELMDGNPVALLKAVKNPTELENMRRVHLRDGAAVTKFIMWMKDNAASGITEMQAGDRLEKFRREQEGFLEPSFETICGYGPHGAIVHYSAEPDTDALIKPEGLLLVDSGGQYTGGTTDITRTVAMGKLTAGQKRSFTLVLRGMLELLNVRFPKGCIGRNLDYAARAPFWQQGLDYNHGTGHGVGYMLSVHEGPQGIRWRKSAHDESAAFLPGMITSNEPGIYIEGEYGVRTENLMECLEDEDNPRFLRFRSITFAPIDLDAIDPDALPEHNRLQLNRYHAEVYQKLAPFMTEDELPRLREMTREI